MAPLELTFLTTTDTPALSKAAVKAARGHVTKRVFAARRARKRAIFRELTQSQAAFDVSSSDDNDKDKQLVSAKPTSPYWREDPSQDLAIDDVFQHLQPLRDIRFRADSTDDSCADASSYNDHDAWRELLCSEPALGEAVMAIAMRYYTKAPASAKASDIHAQRALQRTLEQCDTEKALSDGFLESAFTMALGERLLSNDAAWKVHINGASSLVRHRQMNGVRGMPSAFVDQVVLDGINEVFGYPRIYHSGVLAQAFQEDNDPALSPLVGCIQALKKWRHRARMNPHWQYYKPPEDAERLWMLLYIQFHYLQLAENRFIHTVAKAAALILRMHVFHSQGDSSAMEKYLHDEAVELRELWSQLPGTTCNIMDLTSCLFWLGAMAAQRGTDTRTWYVERLRRGALAARDSYDDAILEILRSAMSLHGKDMRSRVGEVWSEVQSGL